MSKITPQELVFWQNTYMSMSEEADKHSEFAYKLGIPRQEAKVLCYKILWEIPFMKPMMEDLVVLDNIRKELNVGSELSG